jgi:TPR repeat protein
MYANGRGVKQDNAEAIKWFRLAAAQGNAVAQGMLGAMYYTGEGVTQDYVRAHMWFNLAGASGDVYGEKDRDLVAAKMTPQQIAEAQKMARECQQRYYKGCD